MCVLSFASLPRPIKLKSFLFRLSSSLHQRFVFPSPFPCTYKCVKQFYGSLSLLAFLLLSALFSPCLFQITLCRFLSYDSAFSGVSISCVWLLYFLFVCVFVSCSAVPLNRLKDASFFVKLMLGTCQIALTAEAHCFCVIRTRCVVGLLELLWCLDALSLSLLRPVREGSFPLIPHNTLIVIRRV